MGARGNILMTPAAIKAHAEKTGVPLPAGFDLNKNVESEKQLGAKKVRQPNKTEAAFGLILEAGKQRGDNDVMSYKYEALTLRWGEDEKTGKIMRYTPDWVVRRFGPGNTRVIEVKGGHIWSRDLVRFRGVRAEWQWLFDFELWQKKGGEWRRIE